MMHPQNALKQNTSPTCRCAPNSDLLNDSTLQVNNRGYVVSESGGGGFSGKCVPDLFPEATVNGRRITGQTKMQGSY